MTTKKKTAKLPPETYTSAEVLSILDQCSKKAPTGIRNRALIVMMWRGLLRVSEALELKPKDVDMDKGSIYVRHGKGDKSRVVGIDPEALEYIARWMDKRTALGLTGRHHLFCKLDGGRVDSSYVRHFLKRIGAKAEVGKRVHAHGFRHTGASELRSEGVDIGVISKQLGHASITQTVRYLDHINPTQVIEAMAERPSFKASSRA